VAVLAAAAVVAIAAAATWLSTLGSNDGGTSPRAGSGGAAVAPSGRSSSSRLPATSQLPAAGICGRVTGTVVTVRIEPDTPSPRCASVADGQWLRVVNGTGDYGRRARTITVVWVPGHPFRLGPGDSRTFPQHFGDYLAPGVHDLRVGRAYRAEIWLH
jgi:hypothetical protein